MKADGDRARAQGIGRGVGRVLLRSATGWTRVADAGATAVVQPGGSGARSRGDRGGG